MGFCQGGRKYLELSSYESTCSESSESFDYGIANHHDVEIAITLTGIYANSKRKNSVMEARMPETCQTKTTIS